MLSHFAIFSQVARSSSRSARLADRCIASWATVDPNSLSAANPAQCYNLGEKLGFVHVFAAASHQPSALLWDRYLLVRHAADF